MRRSQKDKEYGCLLQLETTALGPLHLWSSEVATRWACLLHCSKNNYQPDSLCV